MLLTPRSRSVSEVLSARPPQHDPSVEAEQLAALEPTADPALDRAEPSADEVPPANELPVGIEAVVPTTTAAAPLPEPTEPEPAWPSPNILRTALVEGAEILTGDGEHWGVVEDLLLDPENGEIAGVRAFCAGAAGTRVVKYQSDGWRVEDARVVWSLADASTTEPERDFGELFQVQEASTIEGEVQAIEMPEHEPVHAVTVKIQDDKKVWHRALVEGGPLVPAINVGEKLVIKACLTRDDLGKLWVASSLTGPEGPVDIRDDEGAVRWRDLAANYVSTRSLKGATLQTFDGDSLVMSDFVIVRQSGAVTGVCLDVGGFAHVLPWQQLQRDEHGRWSTLLSVAAIRELPQCTGEASELAEEAPEAIPASADE